MSGVELFENGIGRPSNEILKKRRNFKIIITVIIAVILVGGSFTVYKLLTSSINGKEKEAVSKCVFPFKQSTCSGTKNDTVKEIQRILCTKGYFANVNAKNCSKETDGYFGTKTTNAIKKFQGKKGLSKDGIVGVSTLKAIAKEGKVDYYTIAYYIANYKGNLSGAQKMDNNGNYQQVVLRGKVQYLTTSKVNTSGYYHVGWKSQRAVSGDTQTLGCYQSSCAWNKQSKYSWISNRNRGIYTLLWQAGQATGGTGSNGQVIRFTPVYCPTNKPVWNYSTSSCTACPKSKPTYNASTNKCQACPKGTAWNGKACVCGVGQKYDTKAKKCVNICKNGQVYKNGKCLTPMNNNGSISIRRTSAIKAIYYGKDNTWRVSFNGYKPNTNINAKTKVNGKAITEGAVTLYHLEGILGRSPKWAYLLSGKDPKKTYYVSNGGTNFSVIGYRYVTNKYADGLKLTYNTILDGYPAAVKVKNSANNDIYVIAYGLKGGNVSTRDTKKLTPSDVLVYDPSDGGYRTLANYYGTISALGLPLSCKSFQTYNKARGTCDNKCTGNRPYYRDGKCVACPSNQVYNASNNTCRCPANKPLYKNGTCQACPKGTVYDTSNNTCKSKAASVTSTSKTWNLHGKTWVIPKKYNYQNVKNAIGVQTRNNCLDFAEAYGVYILGATGEYGEKGSTKVSDRRWIGNETRCYWPTHYGATNHEIDRTPGYMYKAIVSEINAGKPVVLYTPRKISNTRWRDHWVLIVGYTRGVTSIRDKDQDAFKKNILILDPADCTNKILVNSYLIWEGYKGYLNPFGDSAGHGGWEDKKNNLGIFWTWPSADKAKACN